MSENENIKVFINDHCICDLGIPAGLDANGNELFTGDIVRVSGIVAMYPILISTNSVVIADQYDSIDGSIVKKANDAEPFVLGLSQAVESGDSWEVALFKRYDPAVDYTGQLINYRVVSDNDISGERL